MGSWAEKARILEPAANRDFSYDARKPPTLVAAETDDG